MSDLYWLNDEQMAKLEPFFPKSHGKPRVDDRRVLSGIIFINRNGLRWRDAPEAYGPHKTLYSRWKRWSEKGIFARMMVGLAAEHNPAVTAPILSASRSDPLGPSLNAIDFEMDDETYARRTALTPPPPPATDRSEQT